jgi:hypothetical protein
VPSIADVIDQVKALLTDVRVELGEEFQQENVAPPSVVFIPRDDQFSPARVRDRAAFHTPSILTRRVGMEIRIWGAADEAANLDASAPDLRATELLVDKVLLAINDVARGAVAYESGDWMPTGGSHHGRLYVARVRFDLPVVPADENAAVVTTTFTRVVEGANVPAGSAAAITTTVDLGVDEEFSPAP